MAFDTTRTAYKHALELQRILMDSSRAEDCPPQVKAQNARAYVELEKLKRIMRGLPANTSQAIKVESTKSKKQSSSLPLEYEPEPTKPLE